jgi:hopanoid biosynthesis associated RND transporter like protein HpnN
LTVATNLPSLFQLINRQFRQAKRERNAQTDSLIQTIPALTRIVAQAEAGIIRPGTPPGPGIHALLGGGPEAEREMYVTLAQGRIYLVTAHALREELNADGVERLRELVRETQAEVPGVNVNITGEPVLEYDEMAQSQIDTTVAAIVSLVIVALIFVYGYQETGRPIKATICLLVGLCYTTGYMTLVVGHLNILTITFLPMLIGLAIDFGAHLVARYEEELRHGKTEREALGKAMVFTGLGIFTGCFTTAGAFLAMGITNFKGIQEMGIISGGGLLICLAPMMTLLPVLLLRGRQNILDHQRPQTDHRARLEQLWLRRPAWMIGLTALFCGLALTQFHKVYFDYDLLNMQSEGLPAVATEKKLINSASNSVLFGAVIANSLPQAKSLEARLTNLTTVASVKSMSAFLDRDADRQLSLIRQLKQEVAEFQFGQVDPGPVNVLLLDQTLWALEGYLGLAIDEVKRENDAALEKSLRVLRHAVTQLRDALSHGNSGQVTARLTAFQQALFNDIRHTFDALRHQDDSGPMRIVDLPPVLRNRFIGQTGKFLLQVYPKEDVWQRDQQEKFVCQLRTIDPNVTGTPVQLYEYTKLLKESYEQAAYYALGAIVLLVLLHFRSLACVVLALLPVGVGTIWMVGLMGWQGIPFNPANIMTLPLVIGIGVTSGIHILNRFAEEQTPGILARSTGLAVIVSALTTVAGFGSLILAKHQGIKSLGYVMSIGTATCMAAALTFLPALMTVLVRWGWRIRKPNGKDGHSTLGREGSREKPQLAYSAENKPEQISTAKMCRLMLVGLVLLGLSRPRLGAEDFSLGLLADQYTLTLESGSSYEAVGPYISFQQKEAQWQWALHPLFSYTSNEELEAKEFDLIYPVMTYDRFSAEYRFQWFQLFSFSGGKDQQAVPTSRTALFPIFFHQRSGNSNLNYTAVLPFYGRIKDRFMRDEIRFALFPLYVRSRKQGVVTDNWLYPIYHQRRGPSLRGWQFWPLAGQEHKGPTTKTNVVGEVETVGGHDRFFALWPLYFSQTTGLGAENPEKTTALLPLFSRQRSPQRDSTTYLWPLFTYTVDRAKKYREWDAPWPLVVFARGEGKTANRLWPLFSHVYNTNLQSGFYLWPIYKYNRFHSETLDRERIRIGLFLYSDLTEKSPDTNAALRRTDLWPLFTARRDRNGNERLQLLAPLEPLLPNNKSVERNYSPVWALWRSEKNGQTGLSSRAILCNLYRYEVTPAAKKCSILFGLFQYQSGPAGKRWRLFYVSLGGKGSGHLLDSAISLRAGPEQPAGRSSGRLVKPKPGEN